MLTQRLEDCRAFTAGDRTLLRELLHPDRQPANIGYSLAHALLARGESSAAHCLRSSEVYYILSGRGMMAIDGERCAVGSGTAVYIPAGAVQSIENISDGPLAFLCIVEPAWQPGDETVLETIPTGDSRAGDPSPRENT